MASGWRSALSLAGLGLVAQVWTGHAARSPSAWRPASAAAACLATFLLWAGTRRERGPGGACILDVRLGDQPFWLVVEPLWGVDGAALGESTSLLGALDGVQVPVWLAVGAVIVLGDARALRSRPRRARNLSATTVGAVGMLEPVVATGVAWRGWSSR